MFSHCADKQIWIQRPYLGTRKCVCVGGLSFTAAHPVRHMAVVVFYRLRVNQDKAVNINEFS